MAPLKPTRGPVGGVLDVATVLGHLRTLIQRLGDVDSKRLLDLDSDLWAHEAQLTVVG